jgi:hypothetical protein
MFVNSRMHALIRSDNIPEVVYEESNEDSAVSI